MLFQMILVLFLFAILAQAWKKGYDYDYSSKCPAHKEPAHDNHRKCLQGLNSQRMVKWGKQNLKMPLRHLGMQFVQSMARAWLAWASAVIDEAKRISLRLIFLMIATPLGPSVEPVSTSNRAIILSPQGKTQTRVCAVANIPNSDAMNASQLTPGRAAIAPVVMVLSGMTNGSNIGRPQTAVDASKKF